MKAIYWITASVLCVAGIAVMGVGAGIASGEYSKGGEDISRKYESADSIELDLNDIKLNFEVSETAKEISVDFTNVRGEAGAQLDNNGKLRIYNKPRYHFVQLFNFGERSSVRIVVPEKDYDIVTFDLDAVSGGTVADLSANRFDADLDASNLTLKSLTVLDGVTKIDVDAGSVSLADCSFCGAELDNDAGKITAENCNFSDDIKVNADASSVHFTDVTVRNIELDADASTVKTSGLKLNGNINAENDASTIKLGISGDKSTFSVFADNDASTLKIDGQKGNLYNNGADHLINIKSSAGTVEVNFN